MKYCIIGHRGVGKSQLLQRMSVYYPNIKRVDLDLEIESVIHEPIKTYFEREGEASFRKLEIHVFKKIYQENTDFIISLGAGFSLEELPQDIDVLFVKRKTDVLGRIFWDRPRLNPEMKSIDEYHFRRQMREPKYLQYASQIYLMPEGIRIPDNEEKIILGDDNLQNRIQATGILTLLPMHLNQMRYLKRLTTDFFEWREDLLPEDKFMQIFEQLSSNKFIFSFRNTVRKTEKFSEEWLQKINKSNDRIIYDWALELGPCPIGRIHIVSLHEYLPGEDLECFLYRLEDGGQAGQHLKASPVIETFYDLMQLMDWQNKDPNNRSILPRTNQQWVKDIGFGEGRWGWVRLYMKGRQKINFWKDFSGSAADQPTLFEWISTPNAPSSFAAVLGYPVRHSRTPQEQKSFWQKQGMPVFAIDIAENQWPYSVTVCHKLGLRFAAVTSPLKKLAFELATEHDPLSKELQSVNTLKFEKVMHPIRSTNTDLQGLIATKNKIAELYPEIVHAIPQIIIWGGGGTLEVVKRVWPQAVAFSMRTGQPREDLQKNWLPDNSQKLIVIWACGPTDAIPPEQIKPDLVIDLNYREDSMARELAMQSKCIYVGGDIMFVAQAEAQMRFSLDK